MPALASRPFGSSPFAGPSIAAAVGAAASAGTPGYFTAYYPGYFTAYCPGSGGRGVPAAVPATPQAGGGGLLGYFTPYDPGYFTQYFPGSGGLVGASSGTAAPLPGTFLAAVRRSLLADATLARMLRGGWWHRIAPRGTPDPVGVYLVPAVTRGPATTAGDYIDDGQLQLTVYGPNDLVARQAVNRAMAVLTDSSPAWATGNTLYFRPASIASPALPALGYGGSRVYGEARVLNFKNRGNFAVG